MSSEMVTPRVNLLAQGMFISSFLNLIDHMILTHSNRVPFRYEILTRYTEHLDSSQKGSTHWLDSLVMKSYGGGSKIYTEEEQKDYKRVILSLTDYDIIKSSITRDVGGRDRTPVGDFCERAIIYFQDNCESKRLSLLLKISDLFLVCNICREGLKNYNRYVENEAICFTDRIFTPRALEAKFRDLSKELYCMESNQVVSPHPILHKLRPRSQSQPPPTPDIPFLNLPSVILSSPKIATPKSPRIAFPKILSPRKNFPKLSSSKNDSPKLSSSKVVVSKLIPEITSSETSQLEAMVKGLLKDTLIALISLSKETAILLDRLIKKATMILPREIPLLSNDCNAEVANDSHHTQSIKTKEIFSSLSAQNLGLDEIESLNFRVEMAVQDQIENSYWKMYSSNKIKKMPHKKREKVLNNSAYTMEYIFRYYELSILTQSAIGVLRPLQAEDPSTLVN